jgi:tetratricopeptide (TPR) repeat protein
MGFADPAHRTVGGVSLDPYVATLGWLAIVMGYLGYIDQAWSRMGEAFSEARRLKRAPTLAHVLYMASWIEWLTSSSEVHTEEFLAQTTEHRFPFYFGLAQAFHGRSLIAHGQGEDGLVSLTQGLEKLRAIGSVLCMPLLFTWLAEAHGMLGQATEQQTSLAEATRIIETTDERVSEAELLRVAGDLQNAVGDRAGAERHYLQAITVAERQSAKLLQLKASVSLARLWRDQGKGAEARDLLAPIYHWFTEGFDAPDLKEAKALLDELA